MDEAQLKLLKVDGAKETSLRAMRALELATTMQPQLFFYSVEL